MRKRLAHLHGIKLIGSATFLFFLFCVQQSCKKMDLTPVFSGSPTEITQRFFTLPANADPSLRKVAEYMKALNSKSEFVTAFVRSNGYPLWSNALHISNREQSNFALSSSLDTNDTIIVLPVAIPDSNFVNSFISARISDDDVRLDLYRSGDYSMYSFNDTPADSISADKAASQIMYLNHSVYGYTDFLLRDNRLFSNAASAGEGENPRLAKFHVTSSGSNLIVPTEITSCTSIYTPVPCSGSSFIASNSSNAIAHCYAYSGEVCTTYIIYSSGGTGTGPGSGGNPSDPGGGGDGSPFPCASSQGRGIQSPGCGSSGNSPVTPVSTPGTTPTPCTKAQLLKAPQINTAFISLKESRLNENREYGCIYTNPQDPLPYEYKIAATDITRENKGQFLFSTSHPINGFFHVHPRTDHLDSLKIFTEPLFSPGDFQEMYEYANTGFDDGTPLIDADTFTFGVVNSNGDAYFLVIDDLNDFNNFVNDYLSSSSKMDDFQKTYASYDIKIQESFQDSELKFMKFLDRHNTGMKMMKANANFSDFSEMRLVNGQVIYIPC